MMSVFDNVVQPVNKRNMMEQVTDFNDKHSVLDCHFLFIKGTGVSEDNSHRGRFHSQFVFEFFLHIFASGLSSPVLRQCFLN